MNAPQEAVSVPVVVLPAEYANAAQTLLGVNRWSTAQCVRMLALSTDYPDAAFSRFSPAELRLMAAAVLLGTHRGIGARDIIRKVAT